MLMTGSHPSWSSLFHLGFFSGTFLCVRRLVPMFNYDLLPAGAKTLTLRGLEEPAHASRGLEEPFFQLCCCVKFWFWREIGFGCTYYLLCTWSTIQLWCCVSFSVLGGNSF